MHSCCWTQSLLATVISVTGDVSEKKPSVSHIGIEVMCMARVKVSFSAISSLLAGGKHWWIGTYAGCTDSKRLCEQRVMCTPRKHQ